MEEPTYAVDDVIEYWDSSKWSAGYSRWHAGVITKITPKGTITVADGGKTYQFRPIRGTTKYRDLQKPSAKDLATRKWLTEKPSGEMAHLSNGLGMMGTPSRVRLDKEPTNPTEIRALIAELEIFAAWWEKEPK